MPWLGLLVLAGAIFLSVTSEVLPTGLLPDMSRGLGVSESRIGFLVTVFAGVVVITAAPMTALTRRYPRKTLVVVVLIGFALSNLLTAVGPTYEIVIVSRIIGGLAHGLFWAVVGAYAAHLVPKEQLGRAIAVTAAGASAAFVLGVPLGTALGHALGWRLAFGVTCGAMLLLAVLVALYLPAVHHIVHVTTGEIPLPLRRDPSLPAIVFVCAITCVVMMGHNIFFTYIVPFFIGVNGFPESSVSTLLFVYGGAGAVGLFLAGWIGIRFPRAGLVGAFLAVAAAVLVMGLFPHLAWLVIVALVVFGAAFGGAPAMLQTRLLMVPRPGCGMRRRPTSPRRSTSRSAVARSSAATCSTRSASRCSRSSTSGWPSWHRVHRRQRRRPGPSPRPGHRLAASSRNRFREPVLTPFQGKTDSRPGGHRSLGKLPTGKTRRNRGRKARLGPAFPPGAPHSPPALTRSGNPFQGKTVPGSLGQASGPHRTAFP